MSIHIAAEKGEVAPKVLLAGDPRRAQYIANRFLRNVIKYNDLRNMWGFTGIWEESGEQISVMGSGMGMASLSIYVNELINEYEVNKIIRVGTCGGFQREVAVGDIVIATNAYTDSLIIKGRLPEHVLVPEADPELLYRAVQIAGQLAIPVHVGSIFSTDLFYQDHNPNWWQTWADNEVIGVEMESAELYTLAARKGIQALTILTVSDSLVTHASMPSEQRETTVDQMVSIALRL